MCYKRILHNLFSSVMQKKRLSTLDLLIESSLQTKTISVTNLGRGINLPIQERSCIKRADRFIGNKKLHAEMGDLYQPYISYLIGSQQVPIILVDWSQVPNTKNHILRATLAGDGRGLTIYEQVHEEKLLNNCQIELAFLDQLEIYLPAGCKPIIVTDAGYRTPWFGKVKALGWDYIGRVRGAPSATYDKNWVQCSSLIKSAKIGFKYLGKQLLTKSKPIETHLYLIKQNSKNRKSVRRKPGGKRDEKNYKRSGKEAWLLASSLSGENLIKIKRVVKIYKKRMQIEQGFRDIKSSNHGFGMRDAYSRKIKRIRILLFIAMLATWIAWLIGVGIEKAKMQFQFQVSSLKTRRVLSLVFLGCRAIKRGVKISPPQLDEAMKFLWNL